MVPDCLLPTAYCLLHFYTRTQNMIKRTTLFLLLCLCNLGMVSCGLFVQELPNGKVPSSRSYDHFVEIKGINYHYTEYPGPGLPILLLHGFASSTYTWEKVAPLLQAKSYHVWALDMKGFGWSDKPKKSVYAPQELMEEVNEWMNVMGLQEVVLVGNSLGGAIAWNMALDHPDKVSKLVLIDAAGFIHEMPLPVRLAGLPGAAAIAELFFGRWMIRDTLEQVYHDPSRITDLQVDAYYDRMRTENALYAVTAVGQSLDEISAKEYSRRIPEVQLETLIIWGREDSWIPVEDGRKFEKALPNATLKIIPGCGHIPQEERPEETAQLILDFLK
jgi:pimeloyl-ACP methyl ester carboxylesterase